MSPLAEPLGLASSSKSRGLTVLTIVGRDGIGAEDGGAGGRE